ncbi:MAG: sigma factor [Planctomycetota bacterium]|nr:sigma factor [Planctomycetota bacterium]
MNRDDATSDESNELVAKLRARDRDAYRLIEAFYAKRLIGLARARLPARVAGKIEPEDVVQSVLKSFFIRSERGEFDQLNDAEGYWHLLAKITRRKCGHKVDLFRTERRDALREQDVDAAWEAVARGPSAHEAVVLIESIEALGRDLESHEVRMLTLLLDGQKPSEIAERIGYSQRMVERFRERLRGRLTRMLDANHDVPQPHAARIPGGAKPA